MVIDDDLDWEEGESLEDNDPEMDDIAFGRLGGGDDADGVTRDATGDTVGGTKVT